MENDLIIGRWPAWFMRLLGGSLPTTYLAYDVETTGFSRQNDLILEFGLCLVHNKVPVNKTGIYIDWYKDEHIDKDWFTGKLEAVQQSMEKDNKPWHITPELLRREGVEPGEAVRWIYKYIKDAQDGNIPFVTHNGWNFDSAMLEQHFLQDMQTEFKFGPNSMLDTGCIEKASQMLDDPIAVPKAGDSLETYFKRIANSRRKGIYWNLTACMKKYRLDQETQISEADMHAAKTDAFVLHLLIERFRSMLAGVPLPEPLLAQSTPAAPAPVSKPKPVTVDEFADAGVPQYRKQRVN